MSGLGGSIGTRVIGATKAVGDIQPASLAVIVRVFRLASRPAWFSGADFFAAPQGSFDFFRFFAICNPGVSPRAVVPF